MSFRYVRLKKNGRVYASIIEDCYNSGKRSSRSVKSFGDLEKARSADPDIESKILAEVGLLNTSGEHSSSVRLEALTKKLSVEDIASSNTEAAQIFNYGIALYRKVWCSLELDSWFNRYAGSRKFQFNIDAAVFCLTASRILAPCSKQRTFDAAGRYIFDFGSLSLRNIYTALDILAEVRKSLIRSVNSSLANLYERAVGIALYDVTTFYFESFDSDGFRERGMSKDNKTNETQVVLGLLIDVDGMPMDYELFAGNTSEMKTIMRVINEYRTYNGLSKLTVIADRGLNSKLNLSELRKSGCDFIVAQSIDRLSKADKEAVLSDENWDQISYGTEGGEVFKIKRLPLDDKDLIVTWSSRRAAHDLKVLEDRWSKSRTLLARGQGAVTASFKHGSRQFITEKKGEKGVYEANEKLYQKRKQYAGFYALTTSCAEMDSAEVYGNLRQLWKIESCFRVMKSEFSTRPVFVWTESRIQGHFMMCYLALVLQRLCERTLSKHGLTLSAGKIISLLNGLQLVKIKLPHNKTELYKRVAYGTSEESFQEEMDLSSKMLKVFEISPLAQTETSDTLRQKLGCKLGLK